MAVQSYDICSMEKSEVLRYMGYQGQDYDSSLDDLIEQGMNRAIEVARPRGVVRVFDVAGEDRTPEGKFVVALKDTALTLSGSSMEKHLHGARAVGVFAVTLGMADERELRRLSLTDRLGHVIFDAASTTLVERAADAAEADVVCQVQERGLFTNFRFSPGYGDLSMQTQPVLLAALDAQRQLGITLSKTLLMTPTKSVTAIVGLFEERQSSTHGSCKGCPCFDFCFLRRTGRTCFDRRKD